MFKYNCQGTLKKLRIIHEFELYKLELDKFDCIKIKINRTIVVPVVYGCEAWSLTLREEHRLRTFEHRALKEIFGPKRD